MEFNMLGVVVGVEDKQGSGLVGWTADLVEERLIEAVGFLDRHVRSGHSPFAGDAPWHLGQGHADVTRQTDAEPASYAKLLADVIDDMAKQRGALDNAEVDRMNEALAWVELLPPRGQMRKLVHTVCQWKGQQGSRVLWGDIQRTMRSAQSKDVLRVTYGRAIDRIVRALIVRASPVSN